MPIIPQASSAAGRVDSVFFFILILCVAVLVFITTALIYFVIKYNRKRHPKGEDIHEKTWLEILWTVIPTILFLTMFYFGWTNFHYTREVPRDAMVIEVTGRQWAWSFMYPNGKQTSDLYLAQDRPVKLELHSLDVIHGFFVPAFRVKEDVVPGKQNYTWFKPTQLGAFDIECTVICGVSHADMLAKTIVVPVEEFEKWYFGDADAPLPDQASSKTADETPPDGKAYAVLRDKFCTTCHSLDGSALVGPTFKGLFGKKRIVLNRKGLEKEIKADDAYLAESIQDPMAEIVKGYPSIKPKSPREENDLEEVIAFLKTIK
jgi:cytochrome c oxidase subunit 2